MNINDVLEEWKYEGPILLAIFQKQRELVDKYKDIEHMPTLPLDIQIRDHQLWLKDFCWRVTEELAEAQEAFFGQEHDWETHVIEELSDAIHFMIEVYVLLDWIPTSWDLIEGHYTKFRGMLSSGANAGRSDAMELRHTYSWSNVVYYLGLFGNTLKNKKWKQTQMLTDVAKSKELLDLALSALIYNLFTWRLTPDGVAQVYFKKYKVNQFRQRSNY